MTFVGFWMISSRRMRIALFLPLLAALYLPMAEAAPSAADVVSSFHGVLLDNMRQGSAQTCGNRVQRLMPQVENTFDLPFLAQHILRRHWSTLSEAQQAAFIAVFEDMTVTTYASQFSSYNGEKFVTLETEDMAGGHRVVHARLELKSGDPVRFDYVMRETPKGWRTINVIAEGVSDLALRSAQYDRVMKDKGFDGLLTQIREQTAKTKSSC